LICRVIAASGVVTAVLLVSVVVPFASGAPVAGCSLGATKALIGGKPACLKAGQTCVRRLAVQYRRYAFECTVGRLVRRPRWEITDLGEIVPTGINNDGQVVGYRSTTPAGDPHAVLWENGFVRDLGTLGGSHSQALAINDRGQVVGTSDAGGGGYHAFLWQNGVMTDLGTLGGISQAVAINASGQIVGNSPPEGATIVHAFLWENGAMTDLGTLGGTSSTAIDINDRGQIIGQSSMVDGAYHAFLWQDGATRDLGTLSGPSLAVGGPSSRPWAINDDGVIVGTSNGRAVLWRTA